MDQEQYLDTFIKLIKGMIDKDKNLLDEALSKDCYLYHMTGLKQTKQQYITDILDGTLNYYQYQIINFDKEIATVRLLAKVYNISKSWWTLEMNLKYVLEDNLTKIKECRVRMG